MEPTDFYYFVLPLAGLIALLVLMVLHHARREERYKKKLAKLAREYMEDRMKQRDAFAKQLEILEAQLHNKTIDKNTYARLKKVLEINFAKRSEEARLQLETEHT
jgi:hypothetical protein